MVVYGVELGAMNPCLNSLFHRRVDLTTFQATVMIRIFTLIQAANDLIEALPFLHGNEDDMNRHRAI